MTVKVVILELAVFRERVFTDIIKLSKCDKLDQYLLILTVQDDF